MAQQPHGQQVQQHARRGQLPLRRRCAVSAHGPLRHRSLQPSVTTNLAPACPHARCTVPEGCCRLRPALEPCAAGTAAIMAAAVPLVGLGVTAAMAVAVAVVAVVVHLTPAVAMAAVAAVVPAAATAARRPPSRGVVPYAVDAAVPPIVRESMVGEALPRAERVELLPHASENTHRRPGVQRRVRQLLRRQRALTPVADLHGRGGQGEFKGWKLQVGAKQPVDRNTSQATHHRCGTQDNNLHIHTNTA